MFKTKNKAERSLLVLFSLFAVSIITVIFYVSWSFDAQRPETNVNADAEIGNFAERKSLTPGWKVYRNKYYKISIDYPGDWKVAETEYEDNTVSSVYFGDPVDTNGYYLVSLEVIKKPSDVSFENWVKNNTYYSGLLMKGFVESKGLLSNYYIDKITIHGMDAYKVSILSDKYFFPKVFNGNLDYYNKECKCNYDRESVYVASGDRIFGITLMNNMNGEKTSNKLVEKGGRYEVETADKTYIKSKEIFSKMMDSFRFAAK